MNDSEYLETGEVSLIRRITGQTLELNLIELRVDTLFASGNILACLIDSLPQGVSVLVGNDLDAKGIGVDVEWSNELSHA